MRGSALTTIHQPLHDGVKTPILTRHDATIRLAFHWRPRLCWFRCLRRRHGLAALERLGPARAGRDAARHGSRSRRRSHEGHGSDRRRRRPIPDVVTVDVPIGPADSKIHCGNTTCSAQTQVCCMTVGNPSTFACVNSVNDCNGGDQVPITLLERGQLRVAGQAPATSAAARPTARTARTRTATASRWRRRCNARRRATRKQASSRSAAARSRRTAPTRSSSASTASARCPATRSANEARFAARVRRRVQRRGADSSLFRTRPSHAARRVADDRRDRTPEAAPPEDARQPDRRRRRQRRDAPKDSGNPYQDPGIACGNAECDPSDEPLLRHGHELLPAVHVRVRVRAADAISSSAPRASRSTATTITTARTAASAAATSTSRTTTRRSRASRRAPATSSTYTQVHFCDPKAPKCATNQKCVASTSLSGYFVCQ